MRNRFNPTLEDIKRILLGNATMEEENAMADMATYASILAKKQLHIPARTSDFDDSELAAMAFIGMRKAMERIARGDATADNTNAYINSAGVYSCKNYIHDTSDRARVLKQKSYGIDVGIPDNVDRTIPVDWECVEERLKTNRWFKKKYGA